jgi:hypothetical protein
MFSSLLPAMLLMVSKNAGMPFGSNPERASRPRPTRSASASLARVKLIGCYASHRRIATACGRADQNGRQHGRGRHQARAALRGDAAGNVPLRDVRNFVSQHTGQLALVLGLQEQAAVYADEAAGQREGVDAVVPDHEEVEALRAIVGLAGQPETQRADVLGDFRVLQDLVLVAQPAHDHAPDLVLVLQRQRGLRRAADVGQILRIGMACAADQDQAGHSGGQQGLERGNGRYFHSRQCGVAG